MVRYKDRIPLAVRAVVAFFTLPCVFAGVVPWLINEQHWGELGRSRWGIIPFTAGLLILLEAVREFFTVGRGTLAPWDPPKRLVVAGLYRHVRNPMYVGITLFLLGWTWWAGSQGLLGYTIVLLIAFHLRIILHEEPNLRRTFPVEWEIYAKHVRRWVPRLRPWEQFGSSQNGVRRPK